MENLKLLFAYTSPERCFDIETGELVKIQIDNSLELGWAKKDILLFTNFEYEYKGIKSMVVPDKLQCYFDKTANKILVINYLLENNLLEDALYWYHDFDAYENEKIEIDLKKDLGLTHYTYKDEFNGGCFFFRPSAKDIFALLTKRIFDRERPRVDEKTLTKLIINGEIGSDRFEKLDPGYNITQRFVRSVVPKAKKPLYVLHFHPQGRDYQTGERMLDAFYPFMSKRLKKYFKNIDRGDLTVIYLTANKIPGIFADRVRKILKEAIGNRPLICSSMEPMKFGDHNIIQDIPKSTSAIYYQMLLAAKLATTPYIAIAEDDTLYPKEHFDFYRPPLDTFAYNLNRWALFTWGVPTYSWKDRVSNASLLAPRELLISALEERFAKWPNGTPPNITGEVGRPMVDRNLGLKVRKFIWKYSTTSIIQINHADSSEQFQREKRKRMGMIRAFDIPYWGKAKDVVKIYE